MENQIALVPEAQETAEMGAVHLFRSLSDERRFAIAPATLGDALPVELGPWEQVGDAIETSGIPMASGNDPVADAIRKNGYYIGHSLEVANDIGQPRHHGVRAPELDEVRFGRALALSELLSRQIEAEADPDVRATAIRIAASRLC